MPQHTFSSATAAVSVSSATPQAGSSAERWPLSPVRYPDPAIQVLHPRFAKYRLANGRLFVDMTPGTSDGIRCDVDGNLWAAAGNGGGGFDGVHVFAPNGDRIGQILLPEKCANICFGGAKRNRLFMAASQSIYALYVEAQGAQIP